MCRDADTVDPWMTCLECVIRLPAWARPPRLSPAGVAACLEVRARIAAGERPAEVPVSLVVAPGARWERSRRRTRRAA